jgi:Bacterial Ig-like domain
MAAEHVARAGVAAICAAVALLISGGTLAYAAPSLSITKPRSGGYTANSTPGFEGTSDDTLDPVTLALYPGTNTTGTPLQTPLVQFAPLTESWLASAESSLPDGQYTAVAEQTEGLEVVSTSVTFTVDTVAPVLSLGALSEDGVVHRARPSFSGDAGTAPGDLSSIAVSIYAGSVASGTPKQTLAATAVGGIWESSATTSPLANGIYTAIAEQHDEAGNVGRSEPTTFAVETSSPTVTLEPQQVTLRKGVAFTNATPHFSGRGGSEPEDAGAVTVKIYSGGSLVRTLPPAVLDGSSWSTAAVTALPDGVYTAQAEQEDTDPLDQTGLSPFSTFTVDSDPPKVTLGSPGNGSSLTGPSIQLTGAAGTAEGDSRAVTLELFAGGSIGEQSPLEAVTVQSSVGAWSGAFGALSPGTYTVRAEQSDDVENVGYSLPVTFTVLAPAGPAPALTPTSPPAPVASFQWFPLTPAVGESVSLISTSTDAGGSITAFAWSLTPAGPWLAGEHILSTTFTTPGTHLVHLQVTAADGLTGEAVEAISVIAPAPTLMQPFPVVRIAGSARSSSVRIMLFTVQAPVGARVSVTCRGRGCPGKGQAFVVSAGGRGQGGASLVSLARFERTLKAGAVLEVRVSKAGQIGKYTRFKIRRGRLPERLDACLAPTGTTPMTCPST